MAFSRKSAHCCLLLLVLVVHLTASFSVEELCNKRCLYGRGGVLCNCNARHFTGKRSSFPEDENVYITDSDIHDEHSKLFPQEGMVHVKPGNNLRGDSLSGNGMHQRDYNRLEAHHLDNLWHREQIENLISSLKSKAASNTAKRSGDDDDENDEGKRNIHAQDNANLLPMLYIEQSMNKDEDGDEVKRTKDEMASKIRQIKTGQYLKRGQHSVSDHTHGDEQADNDEDVVPDSDIQSHHLIQLQRVLKRALHGR